VIVEGITASALAVFSESSSLGLLLEEALLVPLPAQEWQTLLTVVLEAILAPEVMLRVRAEVAQLTTAAGGRLVAAPDPAPVSVSGGAGAAMPVLELAADERRVVAHAVDVLRERGAEAVSIVEVCAAAGVSRGWFTRRIGTREELVHLARLATLIASVEREAAAYEQAFAAPDANALAERLAEVVARSAAPGFLVDAWDRLDVIVAATGAPFARDAGAVIARELERTGAAVADAQSRGVVRSDVSARALATFLWAAPITFLLGDVAGVPEDEQRALASRISTVLGAA
jgi:AcrR family transcriptional regulator